MNLYTNDGKFIANVDIRCEFRNHDHIQINMAAIAKNIHVRMFDYLTAIIDGDKAVICTDEDSKIALAAIE